MLNTTFVLKCLCGKVGKTSKWSVIHQIWWETDWLLISRFPVTNDSQVSDSWTKQTSWHLTADGRSLALNVTSEALTFASSSPASTEQPQTASSSELCWRRQNKSTRTRLSYCCDRDHVPVGGSTYMCQQINQKNKTKKKLSSDVTSSQEEAELQT